MLSLSDILKFLVLRPLQGTCKYAVCSPFSFLCFFYFFSLFTPWLYLVVWFFISLFCRPFFCSFDSLSSSFNFFLFFFFVILINSLLPCRLSVLFLFSSYIFVFFFQLDCKPLPTSQLYLDNAIHFLTAFSNHAPGPME